MTDEKIENLEIRLRVVEESLARRDNVNDAALTNEELLNLRNRLETVED
jgi:hypothetical protein